MEFGKTTTVITSCPVTSDSNSLRKLFVMYAHRERPDAYERIRKTALSSPYIRSKCECTRECIFAFVSSEPEHVLLAEKCPLARFVLVYKAPAFGKGHAGERGRYKARLLIFHQSIKCQSEICVYCQISLQRVPFRP